MAAELRQRQQKPAQAVKGKPELKELATHPGGKIKHSGATQVLRFLLVIVYFFSSCCSIVATQLLGVPLYWINRDYYYSYMALTKQSFGIFVTTLTQYWAPTVIRVSGDASVAGQLRCTPDGRVELDFPDRLVMIANHQLYTDWLYLWWAAYTNKRKMHGHIFIILKESLRYVPIVGWGMAFYGFVFMSRKMSTDEARLAHRLKQLKSVHSGPLSGTKGLDPMWLLLFPEGTNLSANTRERSAAWAKKQGFKDFEQVLVPRSTGSFFCLNELKGTVDFIYDCTLAYEGVPQGEYGQDIFTLRTSYLQGRPPPSVNMHWRRFAIKDIPLQDHDSFDLWLRERWHEKDVLINEYLATGLFPATPFAIKGHVDNMTKEGHIETEVKLAHFWEIGNIFVVLAGAGLFTHLLVKLRDVMFYGS